MKVFKEIAYWSPVALAFALYIFCLAASICWEGFGL